ncbi:MAG: alternative ribosome rescue aminoacyl-tRNA hydrolase ArfB [Gammaproteobacteria bacterium]|nr:alternative ribosome rescue aminoacyl-tRNA hydrolase ArfB [Gammaproteobacteria bacterium]MDH5654221.1 alternative ribosome rescue aminoacyl-tRNA hydrolase ArfB [Gammaproteobacteria bacterium]
MVVISKTVSIPDHEIVFEAVRAQGPGGQHVNKTASAVQLRFDIHASSLPPFYKQKLLALHDQRINQNGVIVIKAQSSRSQEQNKLDALARLQELIRSVAKVQKKRIPTKPGRAAAKRRLESKSRHSKIKAGRQKVQTDQ